MRTASATDAPITSDVRRRGTGHLVGDVIRRFTDADGSSHTRALGYQGMFAMLSGFIGLVGGGDAAPVAGDDIFAGDKSGAGYLAVVVAAARHALDAGDCRIGSADTRPALLGSTHIFARPDQPARDHRQGKTGDHQGADDDAGTSGLRRSPASCRPGNGLPLTRDGGA